MSHLTQLPEIAITAHRALEATTDETPLAERKAMNDDILR